MKKTPHKPANHNAHMKKASPQFATVYMKRICKKVQHALVKTFQVNLYFDLLKFNMLSCQVINETTLALTFCCKKTDNTPLLKTCVAC